MVQAMNIVYAIGSKLYVNLTNRCSCDCTFCLRQEGDGAHGSDTLWLSHEPDFDEVMAAFEAFSVEDFDEVVFCGYGEPTEAFDLLLRVARAVKERYGKPIRINTNGQGSLICGRDIVPELAGVVDALSISLNTPDPRRYLELTRSRFGEEAYPALLDFAREAKRSVPDVTLTTVATTLTEEEEQECRRLCERMGVRYRIRPWV